MAGTQVSPDCQCTRLHTEHYLVFILLLAIACYHLFLKGTITVQLTEKSILLRTLALLLPSLCAMDQRANHVLLLFRNKSTTIEAKIEELQKLKALIKHNAVPESAAAITFEVIRNAIDTPQLAILGFSALTHLVKRYVIQNLQPALCPQAKSTYPLLVRSLGNAKDSIRSCAIKAFVELWASCPADVEEAIRDKSLTATNPRTKVSAMHWITSMNKERELPFKSFVPHIIDCVKDADAAVKHTAISSLIQLFSNVSESAKEDLKKQLVQKWIQRAAIAQIYSGLGIELVEEVIHNNSLALDRTVPGAAHNQPAPGLSTEIGQHMDPIPIYNFEYLQDMFRNMEQWFEGKESESNWAKREFHVIELRRLCRGNAPEYYTSIFLLGIKSLLDGLLKTVNSLRTTLSNNGCLLIQDLARAFGPGLDGMVEILMQNLIKLCGATKTITAENGNHTVQAILAHVTFNTRLLAHIWNACQDKNSRPRQFATAWLNIIISRNAHNMNIFEHGSSLDLIERCLKRGLSDSNPQVRECMRATYWTYWGQDKDRASRIMSTMDPKHQELLLKDPGNPNPAKTSDVLAHSTNDDKKPSFTRNLTAASSKPSLKETMLAQKRAKQAALTAIEIPPNPHVTTDTAEPTSGQLSNTKAKVTTVSSATPKPTPSFLTNASSSKIGSLNSAPVRPLRHAKKETNRPGTADPTQGSKSTKSESTPASPRGLSNRPRPKSSMALTRGISKTIVIKEEAPLNNSLKAESPSKEKAPSPVIKETILVVDLKKTPPSHDTILKPFTPIKTTATHNYDLPHPATPINSPLKGLITDSDDRSHPTTPPRTPQTPRPEFTLPPPSPLQIYEDPYQNDGTIERPPYNKDVVDALAELDVNYERHRAATPPRLTPERQASYAAWKAAEESENQKSGSIELPPDMINDHKTIDSCIRAIRAKVMDNFGFRSLQKIIRINDLRIWGDGVRFDALLFATIEYLEKPKPSIDVSTQLMVTLRMLSRTYHSRFDTYDARVLCALITCRRYYKATHHVVSGVEELCDELVCQTFVPVQCVEAILDTIQTETNDEAGTTSVMLGIHVLKTLLERITTSKLFGNNELDPHVWQRLTKLTKKLLIDDCVNVRMVSYEFCITVFNAAPIPLAFWDDLNGLPSDAKALMQYYISRHERKQLAGVD